MNRSIGAVSALLLGFAVLAVSALADEAESEETLQLFAVEVRVGPNWDDSKQAHEQAYFSEHSANLKQLRSEEHIIMGARYSDVGLLVFSARSIDEVRAMMDQDPSMTAGTFVYEVHPFSVFYPGLVKQ